MVPAPRSHHPVHEIEAYDRSDILHLHQDAAGVAQ